MSTPTLRRPVATAPLDGLTLVGESGGNLLGPELRGAVRATRLGDVGTPFVLFTSPHATVDEQVLARMLAVLRTRPDVPAAVGGLLDHEGRSTWPLVSHMDAFARAGDLADVVVHTRSLALGTPAAAVLRTDAVVGPVDDLLVFRSLRAAHPDTPVHLHADVVTRLPDEELRDLGDAVDWARVVAEHPSDGLVSHLLDVEPLQLRPWWDREDLAVVTAALRAGTWPDPGDHLEPSVRLLLARAALHAEDHDRAAALLVPLLEVSPPRVEAVVLVAEVFLQRGDVAEAERLLGMARTRAPYDAEVFRRARALMTRRPRPPIGLGPPHVLRGPGVLHAEPVAGRTTVVVVTYHSQDTIRACVEPLLGHDDLEVVVVDNSTDDRTVEALGDLPVHLRRPGRNLGFAAGCNHGVEVATGDAVLLLNPDAVATPDAVRRLRATMLAHDLDAVGPLSDYVAGTQNAMNHLPSAALAVRDGEDGLGRTRRLDALAEQAFGDHVEPASLLIGFCLMVHRRALERVGGLDPDLFFGNDDLDLSWRITETGGSLGIATGVFVHHVGHVSALTVSTQRRADLVKASTTVLSRKLEAYYGPEVPSGMALWGIPWFRAQA